MRGAGTWKGGSWRGPEREVSWKGAVGEET